MTAREEALRLVRQGHDLHYAEGGDDPDLALLDGDRLYAAGLEKLAAEGDLEAIRALADLISDCARAAAASTVRATWSGVWAREGNQASNCDGGA